MRLYNCILTLTRDERLKGIQSFLQKDGYEYSLHDSGAQYIYEGYSGEVKKSLFINSNSGEITLKL